MRKLKVELNIEGMSQFDPSVNKNYQNSACGPTTVHIILNYLLNESHIVKDVNELYEILGGTKIGLFKWRLIKNLQNYLGPDWIVEKCTLHEALRQLDHNRPVAMKFDRYFTLQWRAKSNFKYHWVPLIGYEIKDDELFLILHDNGWKNRGSVKRTVRYSDNYKVLTFIKIEPKVLSHK